MKQLIKFTNVKYYRGGSKVPYRLRFNQNVTLYINNADDYTDRQLIYLLPFIHEGRYMPNCSTTKIIRL